MKKNRTGNFKVSLQRRDFDLQDRHGIDYEKNCFSVHGDVRMCKILFLRSMKNSRQFKLLWTLWKKIVQQILKNRCKGKTWIFKTMVDLVMKQIFPVSIKSFEFVKC